MFCILVIGALECFFFKFFNLKQTNSTAMWNDKVLYPLWVA